MRKGYNWLCYRRGHRSCSVTEAVLTFELICNVGLLFVSVTNRFYSIFSAPRNLYSWVLFILN